MNIYIICKVTGTGDEYNRKLYSYAEFLQNEGHTVYLPSRDTDQTLPVIDICRLNLTAMKHAKEIHIFYDETTHFEMGMAFALKKKIKTVDDGMYIAQKHLDTC